MTVNLNYICLRCGKKSMLIDEVTGEQFCAKCGYVISEKVDESGPGRRSYSTPGDVDTTRTGSLTFITRYDKGLSTIINPLNKDARREHFHDVYGMTEHVHITREKMQQLILYLPMLTVYLILNRSMNLDGVAQLADKLRNLYLKLVSDAIQSTFYF